MTRLRARPAHATASTWAFCRHAYRIAAGKESVHVIDTATGATRFVLDTRRQG